MVPSDINIYAKYNTYDNAEPIITQRYNSDVKIDEIINPHIIISNDLYKVKKIYRVFHIIQFLLKVFALF
mgnify:CR=1 FL=1